MLISKAIHFFRPIYIPILKSKIFFWINNKPFLSDTKYLRIKFKKIMGYDLPLDNPQSFSEKLQWIKINDRKPQYTMMVDKILAKEYVASIIGSNYIVPTLEVWEDPSDIDFSSLPDSFVIKCNHNSGSGMVICKDKSLLEKNKIVLDLRKALKCNNYYINREWPYKNVNKKVFAEELLIDPNAPNVSSDGLIDYKFYCFNGEPKFLYVGYANIVNNRKQDVLTFYNLDFTLADFGRSDYPKISFEIAKPDNFDDMIDIARKLSKGTYFVRVDLYNINGDIKFSEFTFFPGGGMASFEPRKADLEIGEMIKLPIKKKC